MPYDFRLTEEQAELYKKCTDFANQEIVPKIKELEKDMNVRKAIYRKMAELGLFVRIVPKEYGGLFVDTISHEICMVAIAKADSGLATTLEASCKGAEAIAHWGTDAQRKKYIPKLVSGELAPAAFAITEEQAGSDANNIQTTATLDGDYYVLNGVKRYITTADIAGFIIVFAKTDERSISAFVVDRGTPGMKTVHEEDKLGLLTVNCVGIEFDNCRIPKENLVGREGQGLQIALKCLDTGRLDIAAQSLGVAEAAYEAALNFAKERKQFGQVITNFQAVSHKLADMELKVSAAKLMLFKGCWARDNQKSCNLEATMAKLYCSEVANEIAYEAQQIFGGRGYVKAFPAERFFRDARVTTIYDGTSEILRNTIAYHLLKKNIIDIN